MKNMSTEKKAKLIYSGELILFSIVFIVVAILRITKVMAYSENRRTIFNWITIFGSSWVFIDFIWLCCSKKRQKKNCWIDKILPLPSAAFIMALDIFCFVKGKAVNGDNFTIAICIIFFYLAGVFLFEGIYHYFKPSPALLEAIKEDEEAKQKEENQNVEERNNSEE